MYIPEYTIHGFMYVCTCTYIVGHATVTGDMTLSDSSISSFLKWTGGINQFRMGDKRLTGAR